MGLRVHVSTHDCACLAFLAIMTSSSSCLPSVIALGGFHANTLLAADQV